ncbi:MAG: DMT family transporter [Rhizobiaceae bacterium]
MAQNKGNLAAIAFMTLGMAATASVDAVIKGATSQAVPAQIVTVVGFGLTAIFSFVLFLRREPLLTRTMVHPAVVARTVFEVVGSFGTVLALSLVSLSLVTAIGQTVPIFATIGAIIVFRERTSPSVWLALAGGLIGMMLIVRPGVSGFDPGILVAVLAAIGLAARDLASRAAPKQVSTPQLGVIGGLAIGCSGIVVILASPEPVADLTLSMALSCVAIIAFAASAFFFITTAMRMGDVSVVSPFRYSRLVFGFAYGVLFFGDEIELNTIIGVALIVVSGIVLLRREFK